MPRMLLMGIIVVMSIIMPFIYMSLAVKWWIAFAVVMLVFAIATPDYLVNKKWEHAFIKAPFIMLASLLNITKIIKTKKKFENRN